jgi:hypothetical protein
MKRRTVLPLLVVVSAFDPDEAPSVRMEVADLRRALPQWLSPKPDP